VTRVAVVDLGTNSTRLLVADVVHGQAREVERLLTVTRLGQDVDAGRTLVPEAMERVYACLDRYARVIEGHGADRTLAYATSAVRDAQNADGFLGEIERRFEMPTRLLSGEEEALLTFGGVAAGREFAEPTLVVDLGGGSTELIVGDDGGVAFHTSLEIGCVRLTERFVRCDPPAGCELEALVLYVRSLLLSTVPADVLPARGVGTAGTVTTLGTLHLGLPEEDPAALHGHRLPAAWIASEAARLSRTPVAELAHRPGIVADRAYVIAAGATAISEIVGFFELDELEISETDILHGVALDLASLKL
jgi:exopolyphosphatase/guanosine-5'-triphosphate,3'-diphosphate pyrophosphatase